MRAFSTIGRLVDASGSPTEGTISFYIKDTQTLATITDVNGTSLPNPISYSNGKTSTQVFLPDIDIQYVSSNGDTGYDLQPRFAVSSQGTDIPSFSTIAWMKIAAGLRDGEPVELLGYNSIGDKPPVTYIYHTGTAEEDGGAVISHTTSGYFQIVEPADIDVRHWGVFGYASIADAHTHAMVGSITSASNYANAHNKKLHFPDMAYYKVSAGTYNSEYGTLFTSTTTQVTIKSDTTRAYNDADYNGRFHFSNDLVRASQMQYVTQYSPSVSCKDFVFDHNVEIDLSRCNIYGRTNATFSTQKTWTDVSIYGTQFINSRNVRITKSFINPTILSNSLSVQDIGIMFSNCRTDSSLWSDTSKYSAFIGSNRNNIDVGNITALAISGQSLSVDTCNVTGAVSCGSISTGNVSVSGNITANGGDLTNMGSIVSEVSSSDESRHIAVNRKSNGTAVTGYPSYYKFHEGTDWVGITGYTPECIVENLDGETTKYVAVGIVPASGPAELVGRAVFCPIGPHKAKRFYKGNGYSGTALPPSGAVQVDVIYYWTADDMTGSHVQVDIPYND